MSLIEVFIFGLLGALCYRWRGHASKYKKFYPRPASQITFSCLYAYAAFLSAGLWAGAIVLGLTTLAVLSGHGNFFLKVPFDEPYKPETLEYPILPLRKILPRYWYKCLGMAVTGLAVSLPCGIATLNPLIALSGALKAPAYMIGHLIYDLSPKVPKKDSSGKTYIGVSYLPRHLDYATEIGEFFTGLFLWGSLWILV